MSQRNNVKKTGAPRTTPLIGGQAHDAPIKTVLKFDTGADGFQMMIYVLIISAIVLLGLGIYFILTTFGHRSL